MADKKFMLALFDLVSLVLARYQGRKKELAPEQAVPRIRDLKDTKLYPVKNGEDPVLRRFQNIETISRSNVSRPPECQRSPSPWQAERRGRDSL
ncbi:MAG TPA: hypothetical protein VJ576_18770 [Rhodocyclaceae bacterium]|nr:hypothetical protein [Rhodocyclaceae bacterium]